MRVADAYWSGAREGRLVLQRCTRCGKVRHYPRILCDNCYSFAVEPINASGLGKVHSWTVAHHAFAPSVEGEVPYVLLTADMAEGVRVLGRFRGDAALAVGLPVTLRFECDAEGLPLPVFAAAGLE